MSDRSNTEHDREESAFGAMRSVSTELAKRYGMEAAGFEQTVFEVCCDTQLTRAEFAGFLLVAKEYKLNPITREIYAFKKQGGGIVPIVSVDGWISLVNSHPQFDGMEFDEKHDDDGKLISITCRLYRKDRSRPTEVTEHLSECKRDTQPWKMEHRMLRHKSLIQCARYAFGFSGIYDEEEGRIIAENKPMKDITPRPEPKRAPAPEPKKAPPAEDETTESSPTMDGVTGSSPRAADGQDGGKPESEPAPEAGNVAAAAPDPAPSLPINDPGELPEFLRRKKDEPEIDREGAEDVEEEPPADEEPEDLPMFSDGEMVRYMDDLRTRYATAPDMESVKEIRADYEAHGKPRMFPLDWQDCDELYDLAMERVNG